MQTMEALELVRYEDESNGLEFYVDEDRGLAYAHRAAIKRMFGITGDDRSLRRRLEGVAKTRVKTAEIETSGGLQRVAVYPADVVAELAIDLCPSLAKDMVNAGANLYMLNRAGYELRIEAPAAQPKLPSYTQALRDLADAIEAKEQLALKSAQDAPKVEFYDLVKTNNKKFSFEEICKIVTFRWSNTYVGRNTLIRFLKDEKVLRHNRLPYQEYLEYFIVEPIPMGRLVVNQTFVKPESVAWLDKLLKEKFHLWKESLNG